METKKEEEESHQRLTAVLEFFQSQVEKKKNPFSSSSYRHISNTVLLRPKFSPFHSSKFSMKMALSTREEARTVVAIICRKRRWFSSDSNPRDYAGENAYVVLRVSETSTFDEIKASFRKLAKETHPDLIASSTDPNSSQRFVQILAAYEILSDSKKRAHYDNYLFSQRKVLQKRSTQGAPMYIYEPHITVSRQMEVVEWLKWYRFAINDIVSQEKVVVGSGYFDVLEGDFYSAIRAAYYGPLIESMDFLPDRFEAEERSVNEAPDVLHLVSGRDLFGMVRLLSKRPEISQSCHEKLTSFTAVDSGLCRSNNTSVGMNSGRVDNAGIPQMQFRHQIHSASDAYKDLELHISGRLVAVATRIPPKSCCNGIQNEDSEDHIHVYLSSHEIPVYTSKEVYMNSVSSSSFASRNLLGTIAGLGTNSEEGSCSVYNNSGTKTHVVMKHRTLLVKHMHWYQVGDEVSICECRCSRARLPPSKFWLFEPRCHMHDIGGWYIETFGRNKKDKTVPCQRQWDGFEAFEQPEKRLHPAMYLLALAYRTLDLEDDRRRKRTIKNICESKLFSILRWCKKLV